MQQMSYLKRSIITAVCIALCLVLPFAFHAIPQSGLILLPMHIPVLLCGLICGGFFGLICGVAGTLLSHLFTGMPLVPMLPAMILELAVFGLVAGLVMTFLRTKKVYLDLYIALVAAMLLGRIVGGAAQALFFSRGAYSLAIWTTTYFVTALPGIAIQLVLLPTIVFALMKARLIPERYI
ncbi:MAG: ECF transporter S component [Oscillospiraceae bacterium]|jgi:hypothetical protein|nr:ECF transporter S component [Oscillospiraceae bacterium]